MDRGAIDVTAIVIAHDVRDEVRSCLESLELHRGALKVQQIVVDNGSGDGTADMVETEFPGTEVVRLTSNEGLPARNHGLRRARGRLRMFIDSDALLTPGALEKLVEALDSEPAAGLVGPRLTYPDGSLQLSTRRFPPLLLPILRRPPLGRFFEHRRTIRRHLMAGEDHVRRREVEYVIGACQLFRGRAQEQAGEIDTKIWFGHDDADWCFRMREAGWKVLYVPEATVIHDYRRASHSSPLSLFSVRFLLAHVHFQRKWWPRRRSLLEQGRRMDCEASAGPGVRSAVSTAAGPRSAA